MNMKKITGIAVCLLALVGLYLGVQAGDLEPPGPPAPTMKTLDEVEPRIPIHASDLPLTIFSSGSYYLAENISTAGGGITIAANTNNVTIDLMGFSLSGGTGRGILAGNPSKNITVKNGTVSGWGGILLVQQVFVDLELVVARHIKIRQKQPGAGQHTSG